MSPRPEPVPLCVPPWEQRAALDAGAVYDQRLGFHAPEGADLDALWVWLPAMYKSKGPCLLPDMLPVTTWERNVRHVWGTATWDRMRKHAYAAAGFRCEVCGAAGVLEAHEKWQLENETCVQRLTGICALCPLCHKAHHLGLAKRIGLLPQVLEHMMRVNRWSRPQLENALTDAKEAWEQRCEWPWTVNFDWLQSSGYFYT